MSVQDVPKPQPTFKSVSSLSKPTYLSLDGLRGVLAIFVILLHWFEGNGLVWFQYSRLAVDLFFMLSGFVIAFAYEDALRQGMPLREFFKARLIRLFPLFALSGVLGAIRFGVLALGSESPVLELQALLGRLTLHMLFIPMPGLDLNGQMFPLNIPAWSLFFELVAYGVYALVYARRSSWLLLLTAGLGAVGTAKWLFVQYSLGDPNSLWPGSFHRFFISGIFRLAFAFSLGVLIWRHLDYLKAIDGRWFPWLVAVITVVFCLPQGWLPYGVLLVVTGVLFPLTIVSGVKFNPPGRWAGLSAWLGDVSYPLYMTHVPLFWMVTGPLKRVFPQIDSLWWGVLTVPLSLVFAHVVLQRFDKPLRAYLKRKLAARGAHLSGSSGQTA